jgi:polar amino acid transport system substrate-binding protein
MPWVRPLLLAALALPVHAETLNLLVYPNPGLFEVSARDTVSGPGADVLRRLAEVSGIALQLQPTPAARALMMITQQPGYCAAGVPRTPERENLFRWAGLMGSGALMLYGRADDAREVQSPEDLRGATVVAQRESQPLAWLREHGLKTYEVNDTLTGLRMLRAGRVDFWLVNDLAGQRAIQLGGGAAPKALHSFGQIDVYIACHRELPAATAERLRQGLEQLRRDGELAEFGLR